MQRILGHASAAATLEVYADLFDDDLNAVAVVLDQVMKNSVVAEMLRIGDSEAILKAS